jgi:hypothetical protein
MKPSTSRKSYCKVRLVGAQLVTAIAQLAPNWRWKIDGVAISTVLIVLVLNKTSIKDSSAGPWMNVVAIFCLGLIMRRNLRAKQNANPSLPEKRRA